MWLELLKDRPPHHISVAPWCLIKQLWQGQPLGLERKKGFYMFFKNM
jgi:hypothetical protein